MLWQATRRIQKRHICDKGFVATSARLYLRSGSHSLLYLFVFNINFASSLSVDDARSNAMLVTSKFNRQDTLARVIIISSSGRYMEAFTMPLCEEH